MQPVQVGEAPIPIPSMQLLTAVSARAIVCAADTATFLFPL